MVVEVLVRVLLGEELALRVGGRLRVPVRVIRILGLPVEVADCVRVRGGERDIEELPVDVFEPAEDRVGEGDAVGVFVPPMDRVEDRVTPMVKEPLDVLVVHGLELDVFDRAEEEVFVGEPEDDFDPL